MIDTGQLYTLPSSYGDSQFNADLLLLPTMAHYFLDLPQGKGQAAAFLTRNATLQTGNYGDLVNR